MKNYLCALATGASAQKLLLIDIQNQRLAASVDLTLTAFQDAVTPLMANMLGIYPSPTQLEAPTYQQVGLTADYNPIYLSCLLLTASGATTTTMGITLYELTPNGYTALVTYTKTFTTPTAVANQAMFLGTDGKIAYVSFPSDDGTTHRILAVGVDGTTTEQTSPLTTLPVVVAGMLGDATRSYLAFGTVNGTTTGAELWTLSGTTWARTQHSLTAWDSNSVYPQSVPLAMAAAAGITPAWFNGRVQPGTVGSSTGSQQPQCYDSNGAYKQKNDNIQDANTSAILYDLSSVIATAISDAGALDSMYQGFAYLAEIATAFWENLVECEEIVA
ncbi:hypothetical protein PMM47T1_13845 [Pseudomonas sp. M47T1]|uniref:hypothetical protein n=1 Tax=Pseudomonas sp. M47T1 TaxID=1179778 RepID=UPI00026085E4|nr:hypothetical protein [Pseudomonas sp. M47T1]EIK96047.1 hypothetical protein PMM47T1_13845 [Pseudomonas sp. M47T1]